MTKVKNVKKVKKVKAKGGKKRQTGGSRAVRHMKHVDMTTHQFSSQASDSQFGGNIFTDIGNGFKSAGDFVYNKVLVPTHDFVKKNKLASKALGLIPGAPAKVAAVVADQFGYGEGRKRKKGHHRHQDSAIAM